MKVLLLHNRYRLAGGEDAVFRVEADLLRSRGVDVLEHQIDNGANGSIAGGVRLVLNSAWSRGSYDQIRRICADFRPDVAHVHNFWMALSPSVHAACRAFGVATVQTLHNFRLLCANALFLREGKVCQDCLGKLPWQGIVRRCYRGSACASAAVTAMIGVNRRLHTWHRDVDAFIALTQHARTQFIAGDLPAERIFVKPNFIRDPGTPGSHPSRSSLILYAGRLSAEKGVDVLLSAWAANRLSRFGRLMLMGDGDCRRSLEQQAAALGLQSPQVAFVGAKSSEEVRTAVSTARAMVLPSVCFENFPLNIVEAFASGRPMVCSNHGAMRELVKDGGSGLTVPPGDSKGLGDALERVLLNDNLADALGRRARAEYLARYTAEHNWTAVLDIYNSALARRHADVPARIQQYR